VFLLEVPFFDLSLKSLSSACSAIRDTKLSICSSVQSVCLTNIPAIAVQYSSLAPVLGYIIVSAADKATLPTSIDKFP